MHACLFLSIDPENLQKLGLMGIKKIYILLSLIILLPGSLLYSFYDALKERTISDFNTRQMILAEQAAQSIEKYFRYYFLDLSYLSEISYIVSINSQGKELLDTYLKTHSHEIRAVTRVSENGRILYTAPPNEMAIGTDISYQDHIQTLIKTQKSVISDVFQTVQGYSAVAYHVPVYKDAKFNGSLGLLIPIHHLAKEFLKNIKIGEQGNAWVISEKGVELYCPVPDHVGKSFFKTFEKSPSILSMAEKMISGKQGITSFTVAKTGTNNVEKIKNQAVFCPILLGNTFWSIVVATPEKEILATMIGFRNKFLFIIAVLITVVSIFSYYVLQSRTQIKEEKKRTETEKALRESEKKYRTLLDDIEDGYFEVDLAGNLTFFNDSVCKILGYPRSELTGMNNREFMDAENAKKVFQTFNQVFNTGNPSKGLDWEVIGKDPSRTIVPSFKVVAVVEEPFGAHPAYTPGFYDVDFSMGYLYQQASNTEEGLAAFLKEWVYDIADRSAYIQHYIERFGYAAFRNLEAAFDYAYPVNYGY